ncbi:uncharacterized protein LOC128665019 [Bombina bombina]|uniref:uncharacterized protein LOC128647702 n=1 Tax=Bombina bombina TaxID=8345 RepID=UPI00235B2217|nr:uncharacterized protein LOC128647702 [Bombina bombina]XP_053575765.1 uncharacterized protein LOC128665019 [Bombina bombina]
MSANEAIQRRRTLMEMSTEEVQDMMQTLISQRNADNANIDVSNSHLWDPVVDDLSNQDNSESNADTQESNSSEDLQRLESLTWCFCGNCKLMPTVIESFCCRENEEIMSHIPEGKACICDAQKHINELDQGFLNRITEITRSFLPMRSQAKEAMTQRAYRKLSYRCFSTWINGELGPKNRKPIPSCIVNSIREHYPAPDNIYVGFHYPEDDGPASEMILD